MSSAKALNRAHAGLMGIESKNGFLGEETLVRLVQADSFLFRQRRYSNERLRVFRDCYRELSRQLEKLSRKNLVATKGLSLTQDWIENCVRYLGYGQFVEDSRTHWGEDGTVVYRKSADGAHSVGIFFSVGHPQISGIEEGKPSLTDAKGNETFKSSRKESLSEQIERAMCIAALPEAILITPHFMCYFRADSKVTGSCLEVRWSEVFKTDNDTAAILATSLFHADFFAYSGASLSDTGTDASEHADDAADGASDEEGGEGADEDSGGGAGVTTAQATPSQELFKEDLEQSRKITEDLHRQVMLALEILANERLEVDPELKKQAIGVKTNDQIAQGLFKDGLFILYRILFVLYAEARRFLPVENPRYSSFYSIEHLRDWSEEHLKRLHYGETDGSGTYIWESLNTIFTLLRRGVKLPAGELVSAYNGQLFSPDQAPFFDRGPALRDAAMARVMTTISKIGGKDSNRRLHFGNLGIEQLGAVYEALLAQRPVVVREPSCWVVAHPNGVGLVTRDFASKMKHFIVEAESAVGVKADQRKRSKGKRGSKVNPVLSDFIAKDRPAYELKLGRFVIAPMGGQRRQTASHYTPPKLAEFLVRRTLKPFIEGKSSAEILNLKIVEPAVGSGGFLIACLRYMAPHLLEAKKREGHLDLKGREATFHDLQGCKREILERCLYGVDINPLSLELCRTSLYLESLVPGAPLPFLHHRLKSGNALVYADLLGRAKSTFSDGVIPNNEPTDEETFPSLFELPLKPLVVEKNVWEAWDQTQEAHRRAKNSKELNEQLRERLQELKLEKKKIMERAWIDWANGSRSKVRALLDLSKKAITEFEALQQSSDIVDAIDTRHKDRLSFIPDMDSLLIEAQGIEIDSRLERQRREALIREQGLKVYNEIVRHQRAFMRLKMLCDVHCSLWFWPVDDYENYPSHGEFHELVNWLLDASTLDRKSKSKLLSKNAFRLLTKSARIAKRERFLQWHVEFAQVFGGQTPGFDVVISNPPWKVVGTKDKEVYPSFDPCFTETDPSKKSATIKMIQKEIPAAADRWLRDTFLAKRISLRWQSGIQSEMPTSGQNDLSTMFVLNGERLVREAGNAEAGGRIGLLVSRSAVFVNGGTRSLRERLFKDWGLQEATSFINFLGIFSIAGYIEFTALVGQPGKKGAPRFVHGVVDPNQLDAVSVGLEAKYFAKVSGKHKPIELDIKLIEKCFARETLAIPGLTDPRQVDIATALHSASGPVVYLDQIDCLVRSGVHQKNGPKMGISEYAENISVRDLPKWEDVLAGKVGNWVPLFSGKDFDAYRPTNVENFTQYALRSKLTELGIDLTIPSLLWRKISQNSDQRTLITSLIPAESHAVDSSYVVQMKSGICELGILLNSVSLDFLMKLQGGPNRTLGQMTSMPLGNYKTAFLKEAVKIVNSNKKSGFMPSVDALIWLHYGQAKGILTREYLSWMLETQFSCLNRHNTTYAAQVMEAFEHYSKQKEMFGVDPTPIFKLKTQKVISIASDYTRPQDIELSNVRKLRKAKV